MLSDDNLKKLAYEVDDIIQSLLEKYQVNPLSLTAVILARIVMTNDFIGSGEDFRELLANVPSPEKVKQQTQVH